MRAQVLRLHSNRLSAIEELAHLSPLRALAHLSLMHNPLSALSEINEPRLGSDKQRQAKNPDKPFSRVVTYPLVRWPAQSMSECLGQSTRSR